MIDDPGFSIEAMQHATYTAWAVTSLLGFAAGLICYAIFRLFRKASNMSAVAALLGLLAAGLAFAGIHIVPYRIEEAPFELTGDFNRAYIDPGWVSIYLPAIAIGTGVFAAWMALRIRGAG